MDRIFVEEIIRDKYRIAAIDRNRIFSAKDPGNLATVFECPLVNRSKEDDAQIFYALAPSIGADKFFADLCDDKSSHKLNYWSISIIDNNNTNIFESVRPLNRDDRVNLYKIYHSITPKNFLTSNSSSLFSLVAFSKHQDWKTGILQRCINSLIKPEYRGESTVLAIIDEQYRRIMRFMIETNENSSAADCLMTDSDKNIISQLRLVIRKIGLKNSLDTTIFQSIPDDLFDLGKRKFEITKDETLESAITDILYNWNGSTLKTVEGGFQIQPNPDVLKGLSYMQLWLTVPDTLSILDAPM